MMQRWADHSRCTKQLCAQNHQVSVNRYKLWRNGCKLWRNADFAPL